MKKEKRLTIPVKFESRLSTTVANANSPPESGLFYIMLEQRSYEPAKRL